MKRALLTTTVIIFTGCNPIPYKYSCRMPDFTAAEGLIVKDTFATSSYFGERCAKPIPKRSVVVRDSASLEVFVQGAWLRLAAHDSNGMPLKLRGPTLRGNDARVDELQNKQLEVEAIGDNGMLVQHFELPFQIQECICVTYDAI